MCGAYKPTNVISISYGIAEGAYSYFYINRQCQEYMKLGLQGVSIIYASQDSGVASGGCIHPDNVNKTTLAANPGAFSPGWPAACPYVTSVGATKVSTISTLLWRPATEDCRSTLERVSPRVLRQYPEATFIPAEGSVTTGLLQIIKKGP